MSQWVRWNTRNRLRELPAEGPMPPGGPAGFHAECEAALRAELAGLGDCPALEPLAAWARDELAEVARCLGGSSAADAHAELQRVLVELRERGLAQRRPPAARPRAG